MSAYFIFHNRVTDRAKMDDYIAKAIVSLKPYDVEFLIYDENCTAVEGKTDLPRTIMFRFKTRAEAERWYNSPEYLAIKPLRMEATEGYAMLLDEYRP